MSPNTNILPYPLLKILYCPNDIHTPNQNNYHLDCDIILSKYIKCVTKNNDNCNLLHDIFVKCLYSNPSICD
jgi:hypothetical protein